MSSSDTAPTKASSYVARVHDVSLRYAETVALAHISLDIPSGCMGGVIGRARVGTSSTDPLSAGARLIQSGTVEVLERNMGDAGQRREVGPTVAYMPQGLGKNPYPTLSLYENTEF